MSLQPFTLPDPDKEVGDPNPPGDVNNIINAAIAQGSYWNVMNAAFGGGADPTGDTDSTDALNDAYAAAPAGQVLVYPPGLYQVSAPLIPNPGVISLLNWGGAYDPAVWGDAASGAVIVPSSGFSGTAVFEFNDVSHAQTQGPTIIGGGIDGVNLPGTTDGIRATGPVNASVVRHFIIANVTGVGINCVNDSMATGQTYPYGWYVEHIKIDGAGEQGLITPNHTDSTWIGVYVLGNSAHTSGHCWSISGPMPNSRLVACRMEWAGSGKDGYHLTGAWGSGTGSGGLTLDGCSSDRNDANGIGITATGNVPVTLNGCMFRRDGRNGGSGGGGYAGINLNGSTIPVVIDGHTVFPGVDDDGSGTASPQYGMSVTNSAANITVGRGYIQGSTASFRNDNTASNLSVDWSGLLRASGPTSAPVYDTSATYAAISAPVVVQNTGTEATLVATTLPPGILQAGSTYRLTAMGTIQVTGTSGTLTFKDYMGGTAAAQSPQMASQGTAAGPVSFWLETYAAVNTAGTAGTYVAHGQGEIEFGTRVNLQTGSTGTTAINTVTATTLKLTAEWATAAANNILTVSVATIERIGST